MYNRDILEMPLESLSFLGKTRCLEIPRGTEGTKSPSNRSGVGCLAGNNAGRRNTGRTRLRKALKPTESYYEDLRSSSTSMMVVI